MKNILLVYGKNIPENIVKAVNSDLIARDFLVHSVLYSDYDSTKSSYLIAKEISALKPDVGYNRVVILGHAVASDNAMQVDEFSATCFNNNQIVTFDIMGSAQNEQSLLRQELAKHFSKVNCIIAIEDKNCFNGFCNGCGYESILVEDGKVIDTGISYNDAFPKVEIPNEAKASSVIAYDRIIATDYIEAAPKFRHFFLTPQEESREFYSVRYAIYRKVADVLKLNPLPFTTQQEFQQYRLTKDNADITLEITKSITDFETLVKNAYRTKHYDAIQTSAKKGIKNTIGVAAVFGIGGVFMLVLRYVSKQMVKDRIPAFAKALKLDRLIEYLQGGKLRDASVNALTGGGANFVTGVCFLITILSSCSCYLMYQELKIKNPSVNLDNIEEQVQQASANLLDLVTGATAEKVV